MCGAEDPSIAGMVLDSPFSDLVDLMMELVDTYKVRLPKFTVSNSELSLTQCLYVIPSQILMHYQNEFHEVSLFYLTCKL